MRYRGSWGGTKVATPGNTKNRVSINADIHDCIGMLVKRMVESGSGREEAIGEGKRNRWQA